MTNLIINHWLWRNISRQQPYKLEFWCSQLIRIFHILASEWIYITSLSNFHNKKLESCSKYKYFRKKKTRTFWSPVPSKHTTNVRYGRSEDYHTGNWPHTVDNSRWHSHGGSSFRLELEGDTFGLLLEQSPFSSISRWPWRSQFPSVHAESRFRLSSLSERQGLGWSSWKKSSFIWTKNGV